MIKQRGEKLQEIYKYRRKTTINIERRKNQENQENDNLFERSEFLIATCEKKKTDRLCGCVCVWMHG